MKKNCDSLYVFLNIYAKSKESGAYFLLKAPFQAPGSHT